MNENEIEGRLAMLGKSAPRITPGQVDAAIVGRLDHEVPGTQIQLCVLTLYNGLTVTGVNEGPVCPENHDPVIGADIAFRAAREKVWGVLGILMAEELYRGNAASTAAAAADEAISTLRAQLAAAEDALVAAGWSFDGARWAPPPQQQGSFVIDPVAADGYSTSEGGQLAAGPAEAEPGIADGTSWERRPDGTETLRTNEPEADEAAQ